MEVQLDRLDFTELTVTREPADRFAGHRFASPTRSVSGRHHPVSGPSHTIRILGNLAARGRCRPSARCLNWRVTYGRLTIVKRIGVGCSADGLRPTDCFG